MRARLRVGVRTRPDLFGGIVYVPQRDDFFAATQDVYSLIRRLSSEWAQADSQDVPAFMALAGLGICETTDPIVAERAYSGPSFLGGFPEIPSITEPLVLNCFCTAHCPLKCTYCHADDLMQQFRASETDADLENVAATARAIPAIVAVITGGDPLTRPARARYLIERLAASKAIVLDTSGVGELQELLPTLKAYGVHVRVSLDSAEPAVNDRIRPSNSTYTPDRAASSRGARATIERCLAEGLAVTVQTVVSNKNDRLDELLALRDFLVGLGVRNWVLHIAVRGGSARRIEEARERLGKTSRAGILPRREVGPDVIRRLVESTVNDEVPIDIRCTDTDQTPNSVFLVGSQGDLYTEGYAHHGKVKLFEAGKGRPDLLRSLWPHIDRFGHARRYLNWNPWLHPSMSIESICYDVPLRDDESAAAEPSTVETESKYVVTDRRQLERRLSELGFRASPPLLQRDEYYDTAAHGLSGTDFVVRLRTQPSGAKVSIKGPRFYATQGEYSRLEIEVACLDADSARQEFASRGLTQTWHLEKRRAIFSPPTGMAVVVLDEIPEVGTFAEIEGSLSSVRDTVAQLRDLIGVPETRNYAELYLAFKEGQGIDRSQVTGASF